MNGTEAAALFRAMADRIDKADPAEFSGCFLVVPPTEGGDPVDGLMVTAKPNPIAFWSSCQGQVILAVEEFSSAGKTAQQRGYR